MPIDLVTLRSGDSEPESVRRIDAFDEYYAKSNECWSAAMRAATMSIPLSPDGQEKRHGVWSES